MGPRGSAVCFLKKVVGPCRGNYTEWHYDSGVRACRSARGVGGGGGSVEYNDFNLKKEVRSVIN